MTYYVASFSGGKDSTAMVLKLIEEHKQLDEVIFIDTTVEFPEIYNNVERIKKYVESNGIKFSILRANNSFEYYLLEHKVVPKNKEKQIRNGYGFPNIHFRWCTRRLKVEVSDRYFKNLGIDDVKVYIGYAYDELERAKDYGNKLYPLIDYKMSESECLQYCYDKGYDFNGLYTKMDRCSCWCCPLQSIKSLRVLYKNYPELWDKLCSWESRLGERENKFRKNISVRELTERFKREDKDE